jgi:hypothetical protein
VSCDLYVVCLIKSASKEHTVPVDLNGGVIIIGIACMKFWLADDCEGMGQWSGQLP